MLYVADLAGAEASRVEREGFDHTDHSRATHGLLAFRRVAIALTSRNEKKYVSYRDSALTKVLQRGLSRDSLVAVLCSISLSAR